MLSERYTRQSFLGPDSEELLSSTTAGIVGLGGGGSHVAQQLAYLGTCNFHLFDPDIVKWPNLNRTVGAEFEDAVIGTSKVVVAQRLIKRINPYAHVQPFASEWQSQLEALRECDVVFGCLDGFMRRAHLEESCRRALIPLIDIGMDVNVGNPYSICGQVFASLPGAQCFRCFGLVRQHDLDEDARRYGEAGDNPQVVWVNGTLASTAVGLFVQMLSPWCQPSRCTIFGYDGDKLTIEEDSRVAHIKKGCEHFHCIDDLGDPFFSSRFAQKAERKNT